VIDPKYTKVVVNRIVNPLTSPISGHYERKDLKVAHRGVIRSVHALGITCLIIFLLFLVLLGLLYLISNTVGADGMVTIDSLWYAVGLVSGIMAGGVLHIFEDSCTVSGIQFFHPDGRRLAGTIRTGDEGEHRPRKFAWVLLVCYIIVFLILIVPMYVLHGEITLMPILENTQILFGTSVIAVGISWVIIFMWAEVKVKLEGHTI
jgi:hypothetical protein